MILFLMYKHQECCLKSFSLILLKDLIHDSQNSANHTIIFLIRFLLLFLFKTSAITLKYVNGKHGWSFLVVLKSFLIMHYLYIFMFKTAAHKCNSPKPSFACKLFSLLSLCCPMPSFYVLLFCLAGMDEDGSFIGKYAQKRDPEQSSAFAILV